MKWLKISAVLVLVMIAVSACSLGSSGGNGSPTSNPSTDAGNAARYLPTLSGYTSHETDSITSAITTATGGAALLTGNPIAAAAVAHIDGMISCYRGVGAVAARIYTENNIAQVLQGNIPKVGALAIINQDRLINNFFSCASGGALGGDESQVPSVQPCVGTGTFTANGETLHYLYAATNPELCGLFVSNLPSS